MFAKFAVLSKFCKCSSIETIGLRRIFQYDCGSKLSNRMVFTNCPTKTIIKVPLLNVSSTFCKRYARLNIACNMSSRSNKETLGNAPRCRRPSQKHSKRLERRNKLRGLKTSHLCCTQQSNVVPIATENQPCLKIVCNMSSSHKGEDKGHSREVGVKDQKSIPESRKKYLRKSRFKGIKKPHMNCKRCQLNKLLKAAKAQNVLIKQNTDLELKKEEENVLESTNNQDVSESQLPSKKVHVEFMESQNLKDFNINKSPQLLTVNNKAEQNKIDIEMKALKPEAIKTSSIGGKKPIINLRTQNLNKTKNVIGASKKNVGVTKPDVTKKTTTETVKSVVKASNLKDYYKNSKPLIATSVVNIISLAQGIILNLYIKLKSKTLPLKIKHELNKFAMQYDIKKYTALASKVFMENIKVMEQKISEKANKAALKPLIELKKGEAIRKTSGSISMNPSTKASKKIIGVKKPDATGKTTTETVKNVAKQSNLKDNSENSKPLIATSVVNIISLARGIKLYLYSKLKSKTLPLKIKHKLNKLAMQYNFKKYKKLASKALMENIKAKEEKNLEKANKAVPKTLMENTKIKEEKVLSASKNSNSAGSKPLIEVKKDEATKETSKNGPMISINSKDNYHKSKPSIEKPIVSSHNLAEKIKPNPKSKSKFKKRLAKIKNKQKKLRRQILASKTLIESSKNKDADISKDTNAADIKEKSKSLLDILIERSTAKVKSQSEEKLKLKPRILTSKLKKKIKKASKRFATKTLMESNKDETSAKVENNPQIYMTKEQELKKSTLGNSNLILAAKNPLEKTVELKIPNKTNTVKILYRPHPRRLKKLMEQRDKLQQQSQIQFNVKEEPETGKGLLINKNDVEPLPNIQFAKNAATKIDLLENKEAKGKTVLSDAISTLLNTANAPKMKIITKPNERVRKNLKSSKKCLCGNDISGTKSSVDKPKNILLLSGKSEKGKDETEKVDADVQMPQSPENKSAAILKTNKLMKFKRFRNTRTRGNISKDNFKHKLGAKDTNTENILDNVTDSILNSTNVTKFKIIINPSENVINNMNISEQSNELPKKTSSKPSIVSNITAAISTVDNPKIFLANKVNEEKTKLKSDSEIPWPIKKTSNLKEAEPQKDSSSSEKVKLLPSVSMVLANNAAAANKLKPSLNAEATTAKPQESIKPAHFQNDKGFGHISKDTGGVLNEVKDEKQNPIKETMTTKPQEITNPANFRNGEGFGHIAKDASGVLNELKEEKPSPIKGQPTKQSTFGKNYLTVPAKNSLDKSLELKVPKKTNAIKILDRPHPRKIKSLMEQHNKLEQKSQAQPSLKEEPKMVKQPTIHSNASDKRSESVAPTKAVLNVVAVQPVAKDSSKKSELGSDIDGTESDEFLKIYVKAEEVKYKKLKARVDAILFRRMLTKKNLKSQGTGSLRTSKFSKSIRSRIGRNNNGSSKGDGSGEKSQGQGSSKKASSSRFWNPLSLTLMPFILGLTVYVMGNVGFAEMFKQMQNKNPSKEPLSRQLIPAYFDSNPTNKKFNLIEPDADENDDKDDDKV